MPKKPYVWTAKTTISPVPSALRGRQGTHRHKYQAPMAVLKGKATTPATNAQYPHPANPRTIAISAEMHRAQISLTDTDGKRMARLSSARWTTERLVTTMVTETPTAIAATLASW